MQAFETAQAIVLMLVAVTGVVVAAMGLKTWRDQLKGRTEYELARRLLRAGYSVRDEMAYVRGRFISAGEIQAAVEAGGLDPALATSGDDRAIAAARSGRWKYLEDALSDLRARK